ncbi:protein kinase [candidate division CSSED10-310 bacterium]|uniref:Protein kinase n=1 Tax=candidate division CSSED10-310 bacterium TaxID=2855610 RepID=A0ABV6Z242_UNCC1
MIRTIGSYIIKEKIGQGGMGVVHRAVHRDTGVSVALKTIRGTNEKMLDSIRREIRALARIKHPGIVRILDEGMSEDLPWYAMELLSGKTLRQYFTLSSETQSFPVAGLAQDLPLETGAVLRTEEIQASWWTTSLGQKEFTAHTTPLKGGLDILKTPIEAAGQEKPCAHHSRPDRQLKKVITMIRHLCIPLAFLHGEGIVHRDLKPDNIIVTGDGRPVLVDFGLMVQFTGDQSRETLLIERGGVGTVNYMAPEQISGELVDARADLYALGCILYELLTGHPPFADWNVTRIIHHHLHTAPLPASTFRDDIPKELDDLILQLLAKKPGHRIGHADVVASLLSPWSDTIPSVHPALIPKSYLYRPAFSGREQALLKCKSYSVQLSKNKGGFILVRGESGIGKTRLIMEFGRAVARQDIRVLTGECTDSSHRPLEALLNPLRSIVDLCRERGLEATERIFGPRGKILALYEPTIDNLPGQESYLTPAALPFSAAKMRLFTYLSETLSTLAKESPLVLIIDDLQWADELVLDYFDFELRSDHFDQWPFIILATFRSESVETRLQKLIDTPGVEIIDLARLDSMNVETIVGDMLSMAQPDRNFCQYLTQQSEGNPLFLAE